MNDINIDEILNKIEILETKQAFQEDTIESLNKVIINQQKDIDFLQLRMKTLQDKVQQSNDGSANDTADEPPPHY